MPETTTKFSVPTDWQADVLEAVSKQMITADKKAFFKLPEMQALAVYHELEIVLQKYLPKKVEEK